MVTNGNDHSTPSIDETRASKLARVNQSDSPMPPIRKRSMIRFTEPMQQQHASTSSPLMQQHRFALPVSVGYPLPSPAARPVNVHHRAPVKKGAQPSADGYFHCRLCDKCFEKVKSLNAHMKSHAMKARAEAEALAEAAAASMLGSSHRLV